MGARVPTDCTIPCTRPHQCPAPCKLQVGPGPGPTQAQVIDPAPPTLLLHGEPRADLTVRSGSPWQSRHCDFIDRAAQLSALSAHAAARAGQQCPTGTNAGERHRWLVSLGLRASVVPDRALRRRCGARARVTTFCLRCAQRPARCLHPSKREWVPRHPRGCPWFATMQPVYAAIRASRRVHRCVASASQVWRVVAREENFLALRSAL